jgi:hypothetical protein
MQQLLSSITLCALNNLPSKVQGLAQSPSFCYHANKTRKQPHNSISNLSANIFVNGITPRSSQESHFEKNKLTQTLIDEKINQRPMCARIQCELAKSRSRIAQANIHVRHTFHVSDAENTLLPREQRRLQIRTQSISCSGRAARVMIKTFLRRLLIKKSSSTFIVARVNSRDLALRTQRSHPRNSTPLGVTPDGAKANSSTSHTERFGEKLGSKLRAYSFASINEV